MSVFNSLYNKNVGFQPVNLYNWVIEFILDEDAYAYMNSRSYHSIKKDGNEWKNTYGNMSWEDQSNLLTFMCKKCNLPKKKLSEVKTFSRGMEASFNGGITIDSSLSLSFDESSNRIVSRILNNLSNFYSNTCYIANSIRSIGEESEDIYSRLEKVRLDNSYGVMVGGSKNPSTYKSYNYRDYELKGGQYTGKSNINNRDLTIKVSMYHNKYGYMRPMEFVEDEKPLEVFTFYKCFINNLKFGDGFEYGSEDNLSIDCDIIYNWYTTTKDEEKIEDYRNKSMTPEATAESYKKDMEGYKDSSSNSTPSEYNRGR